MKKINDKIYRLDKEIGQKRALNTSRKATIVNKVSVNDLEEIFGEVERSPSPDEKVQYEWYFNVDGKIVTLYEYKNYGELSKRTKVIFRLGAKSNAEAKILADYISSEGYKTIIDRWGR